MAWFNLELMKGHEEANAAEAKRAQASSSSKVSSETMSNTAYIIEENKRSKIKQQTGEENLNYVKSLTRKVFALVINETRDAQITTDERRVIAASATMGAVNKRASWFLPDDAKRLRTEAEQYIYEHGGAFKEFEE